MNNYCFWQYCNYCYVHH